MVYNDAGSDCGQYLAPRDFAVFDYHLPGVNGIRLMLTVRNLNPAFLERQSMQTMKQTNEEAAPADRLFLEKPCIK